VEFLSDEWYRAANQALQSVDVGQTELSVAYVFEQSSHYIVLANGNASVSRETESADVTLRQTGDVAAALRTGSLSALTAIQEGLISVEGDLGRLIEAREVMNSIDKALNSLSESQSS
jgi:hypothetical protein